LDHRGGLTQGYSFLLGVAAVDDGVRSLAVCDGDFGREGGERETELVGNLDIVY
jgi:hypothetical protein